MKVEIKLSQAVQSKPHILSRKEKNCYLLVNRKNGTVLVVNDLGIEIWNQISRKIMVKDLVENLAKKYNVEFELSRTETIKLLEELLQNDFLSLASDPDTLMIYPRKKFSNYSN